MIRFSLARLAPAVVALSLFTGAAVAQDAGEQPKTAAPVVEFLGHVRHL